jgi:FkbM family methyltransferase
MAGNSATRRVVKRTLAPLVNTRPYHWMRCLAMGWDIRTGAWREPELDLIRYVVKPGDSVIDVGANYGLYCYHLSRAVGARGKVFAFEPIPLTCDGLRVVTRALRLRNVEVHEKGCGDKPGKLSFAVPLQENGAMIPGTVHLADRINDRPGREQHARYAKTREIQCDVVVLDDYLPSLTNLSFIKCDTEGADFHVLRGARKLIERNLPLVVSEINPWFLDGYGIKLEEFVGFFAGMGYKVYRYADERLIPTPIDKINEDNWVFVHDDRRQLVGALL